MITELELKAIFDSFKLHVAGVVTDVDNYGSRVEGFESIRKQNFDWQGVCMTAVTSAMRHPQYANCCYLALRFEHSGDRMLNLSEIYPGLRDLLKDYLREDTSTVNWKVRSGVVSMRGDRLIYTVSTFDVP